MVSVSPWARALPELAARALAELNPRALPEPEPRALAELLCDHLARTLTDQCSLDGVNRLVGAALGSEPVRTIAEVGFEDRLNDQLRRLLNNAIPDRRDAQRS